MKVSDIITGSTPSLSFEVFPPKTFDNLDSVLQASGAIASLSPSYMSVTYGAGGTTAAYTAEIASSLLAQGVTPVAHLTCVSATKEKITEQLNKTGNET